MENATLENLKRTILTANSLPDDLTDFPVVMIPQDMKLESLERFQEAPNAFRGDLQTHFIDDFARYIRDNQGATCFVNPESMTANAYFDLGSPEWPGHGNHQAHLKLIKTAPLMAIEGINGDRMSQRELSDWLQDWVPYLTAVDGEGGAMDLKKAISAVRTIDISTTRNETHEDGDFRGKRSAMEQVEASSRDQLPAGFRFNCQPYQCLGHRDFYVRLSVSGGNGDEPKLTLRLVKMEAIQEEMAQEFRERLEESFGSETTVYVGSFEKR
mgnify:CR=1 FL=1